MNTGYQSGWNGQFMGGSMGPRERVPTEDEELLRDLQTERDLIVTLRQLEELGVPAHKQLAIPANNRAYDDNRHYVDYSDYPCEESEKAPVFCSAPAAQPAAKRPGLLQRLFGR